MKVAHLTSVHTAFDVRVFHKECQSLAREGYEVVLIAPHDGDEFIDGVRVRAVPRPKSRLWRMAITTVQVLVAALRESAAVYHFHDPELMPIGIVLKLLGKKVIYDVHEDVPLQIMTKAWIPNWLRPLVSRCAVMAEGVGTMFFDRVVAVTDAIAEHLPAQKTMLVQNFPILGEFVTGEVSPYSERAPCVVYIGAISTTRGIREMVEAVGRLSATHEVRLVLAGQFSSARLEQQVRQLPAWKQVDFAGWQSRKSLARLLGRSRIGLLLVHPLPNRRGSQPNKLFEYMSAGLPVVASNAPHWQEIIKAAGCGLVVDPGNLGEITGAITWLLENPEEAELMGKRGAEAVQKHYNWGTESRKLLTMYEELLA